ncbi:MAG TPA: SapC family protein [Sphingomicrobium sp.]|jgi:hypothetical protein|nr:SapC family protein [Sphingomicrobium sp.]
MSAHTQLDPETHRDLRVNMEASAELGDGVMACLTFPYEFRRVQNEFPILFRKDIASGSFSALALFGFEPGENLFLANGRWDARYKPLALAVQPFLIGRSPNPDRPPEVHVDLDHPRIARGSVGVRLFDDLGRPSPFLDQAASRLGDLDEAFRASGDFYEAIERYQLLEPFSLDVELNDGSKHRLVGYHLIDEDRLMSLSPAETGELHRLGHLMPMFMALASLSNIAGLVERKNRTLADG